MLLYYVTLKYITRKKDKKAYFNQKLYNIKQEKEAKDNIYSCLVYIIQVSIYFMSLNNSLYSMNYYYYSFELL